MKRPASTLRYQPTTTWESLRAPAAARQAVIEAALGRLDAAA
ncbi:MAG: hypothetical protein AB7N76_30425 [Planctomycetota bacterium]